MHKSIENTKSKMNQRIEQSNEIKMKKTRQSKKGKIHQQISKCSMEIWEDKNQN